MNEIGQQSPQSIAARASAVSSKSLVTGVKGTGQNVPPAKGLAADKGGDKLPPSVQKRPESNSGHLGGAVRDNIESAVAKMNEFTQVKQRDIQFKLDKSLGRTVVAVVDRNSKEVIRQIPDETFLKLARNLKDQLDMQLTADGIGGNDLQLINTRA